MLRKRLFLGSAFVVLAAASALLLATRRDPINRNGFARLKQGMSPAEVAAVLGPPGDHTSGPIIDADPPWYLEFGFRPQEIHLSRRVVWYGNSATIEVHYDSSLTLVYAMYEARRMKKQTPFQHLLWRGKRALRRWLP